jgi:hypothetical protein
MYTENEITAWLEPLFDAAESTDIDLWAIVERATVRVAEGSETERRSDMEAHLGVWPDLRGAEVRLVVDWVRFGRLLRHELGWDASYPEDPAVVREQLRRKRELIRHQICEQLTEFGGLG